MNGVKLIEPNNFTTVSTKELMYLKTIAYD